jgi:hypothetical protein
MRHEQGHTEAVTLSLIPVSKRAAALVEFPVLDTRTVGYGELDPKPDKNSHCFDCKKAPSLSKLSCTSTSRSPRAEIMEPTKRNTRNPHD